MGGTEGEKGKRAGDCEGRRREGGDDSQVTQLPSRGWHSRRGYASGRPNTAAHGCPLVAGCTQGRESLPLGL